ncbi:MAG: hypothetical protein MAG795_00628 [Candidatus Woesearchaeota archaeon]|nr:hypothetical protein [Candidatus Woesearchaeota archaeon]
MNKKAALFTIITFLMLFSLFVLAGAYTHKNKKMSQLFTEIKTSSQIRYYEDDIISDVFSELCFFSINPIERNSQNTTLSFSINDYQTGNDYSSDFIDYVDYIENTYSQQNNINVSMQNFTSNLVIQPYGTQISLNNSIQILNNWTHLNKITIKVFINQDITNHTNTSPVDTGGTQLQVEVYDSSSKQLLDDTTAFLDPDLLNSDFTVTLESGDMVEIGFKNTLNPGTLTVNSDFPVNITTLQLKHNNTDSQVKITAGQINLQSNIVGLKKQGDILIKGELQ